MLPPISPRFLTADRPSGLPSIARGIKTSTAAGETRKIPAPTANNQYRPTRGGATNAPPEATRTHDELLWIMTSFFAEQQSKMRAKPHRAHRIAKTHAYSILGSTCPDAASPPACAPRLSPCTPTPESNPLQASLKDEFKPNYKTRGPMRRCVGGDRRRQAPVRVPPGRAEFSVPSSDGIDDDRPLILP